MRTFAQIFAFILLALSAIIGVSSFFGAYVALGFGTGLLIAAVAPIGMGVFAIIIMMLCSIDARLEDAARRAR